MPKLAQTASFFADPGTEEVLELIWHYQRAAAVLVGELQRQAGTKDLLRAWRTKKISRSGVLKHSRARYSFHGVGCCFELRGRVIDVDFGPEGRADGFDDWRLSQFARSAFEWRGLSDEQINHGLKELVSVGVAVHPDWEPAPHLLYLGEDLRH